MTWAGGKALVKKVGRTLDKLNRILRASNEYFRA
jgi:hypothetical protein